MVDLTTETFENINHPDIPITHFPRVCSIFEQIKMSGKLNNIYCICYVSKAAFFDVWYLQIIWNIVFTTTESVNNDYPNIYWKRIFVDTLSTNKSYAVDTVSTNKNYAVDTVSTNKNYAVDTLSAQCTKVHFGWHLD